MNCQEKSVLLWIDFTLIRFIMWKEFIISTFITILAKALESKPDSKVAKILLDDKVKNTIQDVARYYVMLEMQTEQEDEG